MGKETCRLLAPLGLKVNAQETPLAVEGAVEFQWRLASVSPGAYDRLWQMLVEKAVVQENGSIDFVFFNGKVIPVEPKEWRH